MNESSKTTLAQAEQEGKYIRKVRSFVKREGRLTKGQQAAIDKCWPAMGLEHSQGMLDFSQIFGNDNGVVLEIGFGMGKSLVEMAKNAPELNFIGIEVHRPGVGACLMEADEQQVTNLRVFEHDAVEVLADCIADGSLTTMQLFFPDPWHKKRHHKRRIVQLEFVESLRSKLKIGGVFHMATDWENYAEHMLEVMQAAPGYKNISEANNFVPRPDNRPLTKFEQRGHRLGHGVWDLMFKRTQ
ncbi:tRNA (guanine-N(7)-)-methyltransferase [Pseudoalteromonas holothuriae]|uniref:tRNA (guanine-N(7)-)-methyltransferase n=1 Tax=Pseudoalteromonas holothuriae TaxID=2963714 RepID=A0A9W4R1C3_9GAMM|nr:MULTISPECIES: tRNA (guanosine(46)-N7)-methyltransferase TrmB [unclassified Pseudoalteromonas]CAH9056308.1 tRNA (guanine-N(7)-)-methyltransferase [Pseudoalteromonas sp. CIP111951]CAH9062786.1 tRNA (guanine-N(7)-)-methyltransferase [Pseudoalteromonas sp. CIP111854]